MTHWLTVPSVLQSLSQHWSSGEQLSPGQVASLQEARSHMAGYDLSQELFKAAYDLAFYSEDYEAEQYSDLAIRLADQYLVLPREKEDAFPLYFEEMLTGHWAAGYYCSLWARMLAADIFSAYVEVRLLSFYVDQCLQHFISGWIRKHRGPAEDILPIEEHLAQVRRLGELCRLVPEVPRPGPHTRGPSQITRPPAICAAQVQESETIIIRYIT